MTKSEVICELSEMIGRLEAIKELIAMGLDDVSNQVEPIKKRLENLRAELYQFWF